ncbi:MAG: hypothetical protein OEZ28_12975 [Nitrospinota bacterium]|nr:hypothetical protein [Nitrospinota bacterium]
MLSRGYEQELEEFVRDDQIWSGYVDVVYWKLSPAQRSEVRKCLYSLLQTKHEKDVMFISRIAYLCGELHITAAESDIRRLKRYSVLYSKETRDNLTHAANMVIEGKNILRTLSQIRLYEVNEGRNLMKQYTYVDNTPWNWEDSIKIGNTALINIMQYLAIVIEDAQNSEELRFNAAWVYLDTIRESFIQRSSHHGYQLFHSITESIKSMKEELTSENSDKISQALESLEAKDATKRSTIARKKKTREEIESEIEAFLHTRNEGSFLAHFSCNYSDSEQGEAKHKLNALFVDKVNELKNSVPKDIDIELYPLLSPVSTLDTFKKYLGMNYQETYKYNDRIKDLSEKIFTLIRVNCALGIESTFIECQKLEKMYPGSKYVSAIKETLREDSINRSRGLLHDDLGRSFFDRIAQHNEGRL